MTWSDSWQAKGANSSKHISSAEKVTYIARSPSYVLCGCLYTALVGQTWYPYWTLGTAWAQRVLTCHLLSAAGNDCTLLGISKSSFLFDPGTAKAAKMLEAAQENIVDGAPTWGLLLSRGICDMLHDIMGKGQLYPFTVTNKQERRNMGRCKEHVEGHEKKKYCPGFCLDILWPTSMEISDHLSYGLPRYMQILLTTCPPPCMWTVLARTNELSGHFSSFSLWRTENSTV